MTSRSPLLHPAILAGILVNVVLLLVGFVVKPYGPDALTYLLVEDGGIEWVQFLCFAALSGLLAFIAADRWVRHGRIRFDVLVLAGLSVLVFGAAGEEVSWFQRVLSLQTSEFFNQHNRQGEMNLHNMVVGGVNIHKVILLKLIFIVAITHNLILPALALKFPSVRTRVEALGLYLPPLAVSVSYFVLLALSQVLFDHPRRGEFGEAFGAVHYFSTVFAAYVAGVNYGQPAVFERPADRTRVSVLFVLVLLFVVLVAWILGAGYLARPEALLNVAD